MHGSGYCIKTENGYGTGNERAIQEAISELCKGKTLLVIAHRLKTIKDADKIFVVSDGQIKERGTHKSLCEQKGLYAHMVELI